MSLNCIQSHPRGVLIKVHAIPRASCTEIVDLKGDRCRIRVKAPPVEGEANIALIAYLAKLFGLPKKQVVLEQGAHGKQKSFLLTGIDVGFAEQVLAQFFSVSNSEDD